jgi:hypothetical protein
VALSEHSITHFNQGNTGAVETATVTVQLAGTDVTVATTDVLIALTWTTANTPGTPTLPSNFALVGSSLTSGSGAAVTALYRRKSSFGVADESSWTVTFAAGVSASWAVLEVAGLDPASVGTVAGGSGSGTLTRTADPVSTTTTPDALILALHSSVNDSTEVVSWDSQTGGFGELTDQCTTRATPRNVSLAVSRLFPAARGTYSCTATMNATGLSTTWANAGLSCLLPGLPRQISLLAHTGYEFATLAGITTGNAGLRLFDESAGTAAMSIVAGRTGGSALRINRTASAFLGWTTATLGVGITSHSVRRYVMVTAATGAPGLLGTTTASGVNLLVSYVAATGKIRVQAGTGVAVDSDHAVALGSWCRIEYRVTVNLTQHTCEWMLDGAPQTTALSQAGVAATTVAASRRGWSDAVTVDASYDDEADAGFAANPAAYPIGDGRGILLGVDPAGTLTVTGSTANFKTFTANGTLAAWDATVASGAISEGPPPTIGASADGLCQITAASGDYVEIPLATYTLQGLEDVNECSMVACGWAAAATAATLAIDAFDDGTTATSGAPIALLVLQDPNFDNSTTAPAWAKRAWGAAAAANWSQARLNAATFQVGFSTDATPDIGIHWIAAEVDLTASIQDQPVFGDVHSGDVLVSATTETVSGAQPLLTVSTPAGKGATLSYGTEGSLVDLVVPAASTVQVVTGAVSAPIPYMVLSPDPEPEIVFRG